MTSQPSWVQRLRRRITTRLINPIQRRIAESLPGWRALEDSEELYRLLVELSPDGIAIRTGGNLTYANPAVVRLLGASSANEVIGKSIQDFIDPEYRDILSERLQKTYQLRPEGQTAQLKFIRLDGQKIDVELTTTIMNLRGKLTGLLMIRDISQRKQAEEVVRRSEELYRTLARNVPKAAILLFDRELRCLVAEGAALTDQGFSKEKLEGQILWEILPRDQAEGLASAYRAALLGQEVILEGEYNGRDYRTQIVPVKNEAGRIFAAMAFSRDVSEEKRLEAQQIELAIEKERVAVLQRFVQDISHDLRTPLSVISTRLYLLERTIESPGERVKHMATLEAQVGRIGKILDDFLVMSRLDKANRDEYEFKPTNLNSLVAEIVGETQTMAEHRRQLLEFKAAETELMILVDEEQFRRVVRHLILNALNFTPEGGRIHLRTWADEQNVILEVADNGIGINTIDLPHIFERFYRADVARSTDAGGSGLGLAIAKRIVEAHGGDIDVESAVGQGTTFRVRLPMLPISGGEST